jgi:hypothetical protein
MTVETALSTLAPMSPRDDLARSYYHDSEVQYKRDRNHTGMRCRSCVSHAVTIIAMRERDRAEMAMGSAPPFTIRTEEAIREEGEPLVNIHNLPLI